MRIILALLFLVCSSIQSFAATGGAASVNITSLTLSSSSTEFAFTFPDGTQEVKFNGSNPNAADRVASKSGNTTTTSPPQYYSFSITPTTIENLSSYGQTLYFSSTLKNETIQIIYTQ